MLLTLEFNGYNDEFLVQVDGQTLVGMSNPQAVEVLKCTGDTVQLKIVRYLRGLHFEDLINNVDGGAAPEHNANGRTTRQVNALAQCRRYLKNANLYLLKPCWSSSE